MRTKMPEQPVQRRTSERRRLKMLQKINEYKISNPYKSQRHHLSFPDELSSQLKKLEYLSSTTISMINFKTATSKDPRSSDILVQMRLASMQQQEKYGILYGTEPEMVVDNPEDKDLMDLSCELDRGQEERDQIITTRQQLSMNLLPFHPVFMDCRQIEEEAFNMMESSPQDQHARDVGLRNEHAYLLDDQYEHYFAA